MLGLGLELGTDDDEGVTDIDGVPVGVTDIDMLGVVLGVEVAAGVTLMLGDGETELVGEGLELGTDDDEGVIDIDGVSVGVTDIDMLGVGLAVEVSDGVTVMVGDGDTVFAGEGLDVGTDEVEGEIEVEGVLEIDAVGLTD